ncbi:MAG: acyl-CoA dehydrogenase, partial [Acidobacteria bacterium]|nr:acyl-CoA dehydrogenase [Acidobacteriota bacterium]
MATTILVLLFLGGGLILLAGLVLAVPALRRPVISRPVMKFMAGVLPSMSDTERIALEAGTVWWDAELFSGRPDWRGMLATQFPGLSRQEEVFLSGPVEKVCA